MTLYDGTEVDRCYQCRAMWDERNARGVEGEPPCDGCKVKLMSENRPAVDIYFAVNDQCLRAGMDGTIVGLDINAVWNTIDHYPRPIDKWDVMQKVRKLFFHFMKKEDK